MPLKYIIFININLSIIFHIKLHIVHTYMILKKLTYFTTPISYYITKIQIYLHDYIIISQNKQDNSRFCTILDYHPPKICC